MDDNEKARLIMHELLMSIYLMRFENMSTICKISARTGAQGCETISPEQLELLNQQLKPETKRRLADADYEAIRAATAWVFANEQQLSEASFNAYAGRIGFSDKRFNNFAKEEDSNSQSTETTISKITLALKKAKLSGKLQNSCLALHSKKTFPCELNWSLTEKKHPTYPELILNTLEVIIKNTETQQVVQQIAHDFIPTQSISISQSAGYFHYTLFPTELWTTTENGQRFSMSVLSFEKDSTGNLTLAGILMLPFVYIDSEKYEKTRTENGQDWQATCEIRSIARIHPQDPGSDTIILMSHGGVMEKVAFMDMIQLNDIENCQTAAPSSPKK